MKIEMVGSFTAPKGNAMPEDCIRCHNAEWGTIVVDSICAKCLVEELAALREAGGMMAKALRDMMADTGTWKHCEDAVTAWEAANK